MNIYEVAKRNCHLGIKALQSIKYSHDAFIRLIELYDKADSLILSSLFQSAVIRYAKPFLNSETDLGKIKLRVKELKNIEGFSNKLHDHLIAIRNTLIAHDDFREVTPKTFTKCIEIEGKDVSIPVFMKITNKSLSYPNSYSATVSYGDHIKATLEGVESILLENIVRLRNITIKNSHYLKETSKKVVNYGGGKLDSSEFTKINYSEDLNATHLDVGTPDFSELHEGFHYDEATFLKEFNGPEKIELPDGSRIEIKPEL